MLSRFYKEHCAIAEKGTAAKILYLVSDLDFRAGHTHEMYEKMRKEDGNNSLPQFEQREIKNINKIIPILQACLTKVMDYKKYQMLSTDQKKMIKMSIASSIYKNSSEAYLKSKLKEFNLPESYRYRLWVKGFINSYLKII